MADKRQNKGANKGEAGNQKTADENTLITQRRQKAQQISEMGYPLFPNLFRPRDTIGAIIKQYANVDAARLESMEHQKFSLAGRIMAIRSFGKAAFLKLQDRSGSLQLHVQRDVLPQDQFKLFKKLDVGDMIGVSGPLFRTRTRELTLRVEHLSLITKSIRPPAREIPRPHRRGGALPPALSGPHHESGGAPDIPGALQHSHHLAEFPYSKGFPGGGDAHDAAHSRRRHRAAL